MRRSIRTDVVTATGIPEAGSANLQQWIWSLLLRNSTNQMGALFRKIERLIKLGVHCN